MNLDELGEGRDMDTLVAELVLKESVVESEECNGIDNLWLAPYQDKWDDRPLKRYSYGIQSAWDIVKHLEQEGFYLRLDSTYHLDLVNRWVATFIHGDFIDIVSAGWTARAKSAPLAICKAAILLKTS